MNKTQRISLEAERLLNRLSRSAEISHIIRAGQAIRSGQIPNKQHLYVMLRTVKGESQCKRK